MIPFALAISFVTLVVAAAAFVYSHNAKVRARLIAYAPHGAYVGGDATVDEAKARIAVWEREQDALRILRGLVMEDDQLSIPTLSPAVRREIDNLLDRAAAARGIVK